MKTAVAAHQVEEFKNKNENRLFTISVLSRWFPQISRTLLCTTVAEMLHHRKDCAKRVTKILSDKQKWHRMRADPTFRQRYKNEGEKFLDYYVTGGETWISYSNGEAKKHSMVQCIVVRQNNGNVKKYFVAESYWVLCLEQKRCFAGGHLQSGSNRHIGSVQWDVKQLRRMAFWLGVPCRGITLATPHCRAHSTAVPVVQLSALKSVPGQ